MIQQIVNIKIRIDLKENILEKVWDKFNTSDGDSYDIYIKVYPLRESHYGIEYFEISSDTEKLLRIDNDIMLMQNDRMRFVILPLYNTYNLQAFTIQAFCTYAVQHHLIQLHSSLVNYNDQGILFLGPSGIGKTTQAELWNKYRDALIINGDMVFVQETEDGFLGWGTPWHGSSPYCENTSVPIHAMIVLKQAPDNSIRELTGFEKVTTVSNSVFYPQWLENGMELCLETLDHLLTKVPVYELSCRPDEEAVTLTEQFIF